MPLFAQRYNRTSRRNGDPNDRIYDRHTQEQVKHMSPSVLDRLLRHGEDDEEDAP